MTGSATARPLVINGRFLTQHPTGVQRFAIETVKAIDQLLTEPRYAALQDRVRLLTPRHSRALQLSHIETRACGRMRGYGWEQLELPCFSTGAVLLNLCMLGPVALRRQIVVVHDATVAAMPESFSPAFRLAYRTMIPLLCRRAARIVTVSEFSRREIARCYGASADAMVVCSEGADHLAAIAPDPAVLRAEGLEGRRFLLAVGVGSRNKNAEAVVKAFAAARLDEDAILVLTGARDQRVHGTATPAQGLDPARVRVLGQVSDAALRALYEHAVALAFPSRYEGFGLPPVEAMECGCPVIISDQPALLEVAGDAALVCGPDDIDALSGLIARLFAEPALRADLARRGRARAARYRWRATAEILLDQCLAVGRP